MLREVKNLRFQRRLTLFGWRYGAVEGARPVGVTWRRRAFDAIRAQQELRPVKVRTAWADVLDLRGSRLLGGRRAGRR
jgi:hypothetical protein